MAAMKDNRWRRTVSLPLIPIELDAWGRGTVAKLFPKPADWTFSVADERCRHLRFAFDPYQPVPSRPRLEPMEPDLRRRGPYVRVSGSLVTDDPHTVDPNSAFFNRFLPFPVDAGEREAAVRDWQPGISPKTADHPARWSEIHPPDLIEVLSPREPRVTLRAVGLVARVGINACEAVEFDVTPEAPRPANGQIAYEELRGPETFWPWGENADNGSWIDVQDDRIHVKARVCGGVGLGSPGRFKALYRVWWKRVAAPPPPPPPPPPSSQPRTRSFVTTDRDEISYLIEPDVAAPTGVEFRLCLGPGLTWEKRMNLPDGQGSSWDIIVKDAKVCDMNSLWANQVANGQSLTFSKAKLFGVIRQVYVLPLTSLGPLPGGTRVTFTWKKD